VELGARLRPLLTGLETDRIAIDHDTMTVGNGRVTLGKLARRRCAEREGLLAEPGAVDIHRVGIPGRWRSIPGCRRRLRIRRFSGCALNALPEPECRESRGDDAETTGAQRGAS
jgi:hypothetical protein